MFLSEASFCLNFISLLLGISASWYFGGADHPLHPDRLIASAVSYSEKAIYRQGAKKEGLYALTVTAVLIGGLTALLLHFTLGAGKSWYLLLSTYLIYSCISISFTKTKKSGDTFDMYMQYASPVIIFTLLAGPLGAVLFRILPIMLAMNPPSDDRFSSYSSTAEESCEVITEASSFMAPMLRYAATSFRKVIRKLKRLLP